MWSFSTRFSFRDSHGSHSDGTDCKSVASAPGGCERRVARGTVAAPVAAWIATPHWMSRSLPERQRRSATGFVFQGFGRRERDKYSDQEHRSRALRQDFAAGRTFLRPPLCSSGRILPPDHITGGEAIARYGPFQKQALAFGDVCSCKQSPASAKKEQEPAAFGAACGLRLD